jgi:phosphopantetheinyl transferase (holo-ACP synthase)
MSQPKWKIHHCENPEKWALSRKKYVSASAQHQASREALEFLLKSHGYSIDPCDINLLKFSTVEGVDDLFVSLSHTSPNLAAAVVGEKSIFQSVGIDLEKSGRQMKINSGHHFLNESDDPELHNELLKGWCKKEAAFKAWSPFWDQEKEGKPLVLKDLDIRGKHFYKRGSKIELGFVELIETNYLDIDLYLTLAWTLT